MEATPDPSAASKSPLSPGDALADALSLSLDTVAKAAGAGDAVKMVHGARKAMKQYRSLLRLVPGEASAAARRHAAAVARTLSHARDRAAAREALDLLATMGLLLPGDRTDARAAVGYDAVDATRRHREAIIAFLAQARADLAGDLGVAVRAVDLTAGLARTYRRARDASFDTPEAMHEARKRVVEHRYQMGFFASAFGHGEKRAQRAQALRDLFGAYQDIETLRPMLHAADPPLEATLRARLDVGMARAQKRLRRKALRRHAALFRSKPRAFRGRLDGC